MAKATSKKTTEVTTTEKPVEAVAPKKSRVTKTAVTKSEKKTSATAGKKPARKITPVRKVVAKGKKASTPAPKKTLSRAKSEGIISTVKNKIASAGHALADKIRSDKNKSLDLPD